jgi:hypothetical protein
MRSKHSALGEYSPVDDDWKLRRGHGDRMRSASGYDLGPSGIWSVRGVYLYEMKPATIFPYAIWRM